MTHEFNISGTATGFPFNPAAGLSVRECFKADYELALDKLLAAESKAERADARAHAAWLTADGGSIFRQRQDAALKAKVALTRAEKRCETARQRFLRTTVA